MPLKGIIYTAINKVNGKQYIGKTIQKLSRRRDRHFYNSKQKNNIPLYNAIRKYGIENFEWKIIASCIGNTKDLNNLEIQLIKQNQTMYPNGYNITQGGDGWPLGKPATGNRAKGKPGTGRTEKGKNNALNKPVVAIHILSNKKYHFFSALEAERQTKSSHGHIAACCKGKRHSHNGYYWSYLIT